MNYRFKYITETPFCSILFFTFNSPPDYETKGVVEKKPGEICLRTGSGNGGWGFFGRCRFRKSEGRPNKPPPTTTANNDTGIGMLLLILEMISKDCVFMQRG